MGDHLIKRRAADCASEEEIYGTEDEQIIKKDASKQHGKLQHHHSQQQQQQQYRANTFDEISSNLAGRAFVAQSADLLCPSSSNPIGSGAPSLFAIEHGSTNEYHHSHDVHGYMAQNHPFIMSAYAPHPPQFAYYPLVENGGGTTTNQLRQPSAADDQQQQVLPTEAATFNNEMQQQSANGNKAAAAKEHLQNNANAAQQQQQQHNALLHVELVALPPPPISTVNFVHNNHHHHLNHFLHHRSPFEPFCTVPGRMSLLSSTTKYKVSIGEIQRRINPPECLNASLIGGILRNHDSRPRNLAKNRAKSKDGGKTLRESLKRIGLSLPAGRRKCACVTAFTALVEEEAIHMANDFNALLQHDFPSKDIGFFLNAQFLRFSCQSPPMDAELVAKRRTMLNCSKIFIREITNLLAADRSPICDRRPELITHGFGGIAMLSMLESLTACLDESLKNLDKLAESSANLPH